MSIRRGVISGFGEVAARAHLPEWRQREDISVMAIHDPIAARRHAAINLRANLRVYDDLALMLDGESPEFVDVTSPPAYHAGAARMALEAGAHVLVEKPLGLDLDEFERLVTLAQARQRVLMCAHNWQFAPAYREASALIAAGRVGEPRYISLARLRNQPAGAVANTAGGVSVSGAAPSSERWRSEAKTGGGLLIDHGWHTFYLIHWLLGLDHEARDQSVGRMEDFSLSAYLGYPPNSSVDDLADLRIHGPAGAIANVHLSWRSPVRRTSATIYGDGGLLEIEGDRLLFTPQDGPAEDYSAGGTPDDSYHRPWFAALAAHFLEALAEGCEGAIVRRNHAEVRFALAATSAARDSAMSGGIPVKLGPR